MRFPTTLAISTAIVYKGSLLVSALECPAPGANDVTCIEKAQGACNDTQTCSIDNCKLNDDFWTLWHGSLLPSATINVEHYKDLQAVSLGGCIHYAGLDILAASESHELRDLDVGFDVRDDSIINVNSLHTKTLTVGDRANITVDGPTLGGKQGGFGSDEGELKIGTDSVIVSKFMSWIPGLATFGQSSNSRLGKVRWLIPESSVNKVERFPSLVIEEGASVTIAGIVPGVYPVDVGQANVFEGDARFHIGLKTYSKFSFGSTFTITNGSVFEMGEGSMANFGEVLVVHNKGSLKVSKDARIEVSSLDLCGNHLHIPIGAVIDVKSDLIICEDTTISGEGTINVAMSVRSSNKNAMTLLRLVEGACVKASGLNVAVAIESGSSLHITGNITMTPAALQMNGGDMQVDGSFSMIGADGMDNFYFGAKSRFVSNGGMISLASLHFGANVEALFQDTVITTTSVLKMDAKAAIAVTSSISTKQLDLQEGARIFSPMLIATEVMSIPNKVEIHATEKADISGVINRPLTIGDEVVMSGKIVAIGCSSLTIGARFDASKAALTIETDYFKSIDIGSDAVISSLEIIDGAEIITIGDHSTAGRIKPSLHTKEITVPGAFVEDTTFGYLCPIFASNVKINWVCADGKIESSKIICPGNRLEFDFVPKDDRDTEIEICGEASPPRFIPAISDDSVDDSIAIQVDNNSKKSHLWILIVVGLLSVALGASAVMWCMFRDKIRAYFSARRKTSTEAADPVKPVECLGTHLKRSSTSLAPHEYVEIRVGNSMKNSSQGDDGQEGHLITSTDGAYNTLTPTYVNAENMYEEFYAANDGKRERRQHLKRKIKHRASGLGEEKALGRYVNGPALFQGTQTAAKLGNSEGNDDESPRNHSTMVAKDETASVVYEPQTVNGAMLVLKEKSGA